MTTHHAEKFEQQQFNIDNPRPAANGTTPTGANPQIEDPNTLHPLGEKIFLDRYALKDGKEVWKTPREEVPTWSTPTVVADGPHPQVLVNGFRHIGGYALADGRELWRMRGGGDIPVPTPIVANGLAYVTNSHSGGKPIYAVRKVWEADRESEADA